MSKGLTTRELARQLGVSASTLRIWEDVLQLDIPRDDVNHRRYPPELVDTLSAIARLRQSGYDYAYIARELRLSIHEPTHEEADELDDEPAVALPVAATVIAPVPPPVAPPPPKPEPTYAAETPTMPTSVLGKESFDVLQAYTRLSEDHRALSAKYAEATFAIGQLEERVLYLTQQLLEAETKVGKLEAAEPKALPAPTPAPANETAIRDLESQVRLLALAVLNNRSMSMWERLTLWWSQ